MSYLFCAYRQRCVLPGCYLLTNIVGSTQEAHIIFFKANFTKNSHHFVYFSRKHTCVLPSVTSLTEHSVCTLKWDSMAYLLAQPPPSHVWNGTRGQGFKPCPHQTFAIMAIESYQWLYWEFIPFEISVVDWCRLAQWAINWSFCSIIPE